MYNLKENEYYKVLFNNVLLVSPNDIKELGYVDDNYDEKKLNTIIKSVQDLYIEPALGSKLYNKVLFEVHENVYADTDNNNLIDGYIIYAVCNLVKSETIIAGYDYTNSGVIQRVNEKIDNTSLKDLQAISSHYKNIADSYIKKMQMFIEVNIKRYPEFRDSNTYGTKKNDTPYYCAINI